MPRERRVPPTRVVKTTPPTKKGWYSNTQSAIEWIEKNPFLRIIAGLSAIFGLYVLWQTSVQIRTDLADRNIERIDNALAKLATRGAYDTGRGGAISFLFAKGWNIHSFDQSCEAVGIWGAQPGQTGNGIDTIAGCLARPTIANLRLVPATPSWGESAYKIWRSILYQFNHIPSWGVMWTFNKVRLDQTDIDDVEIIDQQFQNINLDGAKIEGGRIVRSSLRGSFNGTAFFGISLTGTVFDGSLAGAKFEGVDLSDVLFITTAGMTKDTLDGVAWADHPPLTLGDYRIVEDDATARVRSAPMLPLPIELMQNVTFCAPPTFNGVNQPANERSRPDQFNCEVVPVTKVIEDRIEWQKEVGRRP